MSEIIEADLKNLTDYEDIENRNGVSHHLSNTTWMGNINVNRCICDLKVFGQVKPTPYENRYEQQTLQDRIEYQNDMIDKDKDHPLIGDRKEIIRTLKKQQRLVVRILKQHEKEAQKEKEICEKCKDFRISKTSNKMKDLIADIGLLDYLNRLKEFDVEKQESFL